MTNDQNEAVQLYPGKCVFPPLHLWNLNINENMCIIFMPIMSCLFSAFLTLIKSQVGMKVTQLCEHME